MQDCYNLNKAKFISILSKIVKDKRIKQGKSITLLSAEIGMTKSMLADLEKCRKDPQLTTIWRICEGLEIPLSSIITELESKLGKDFSLIDY